MRKGRSHNEALNYYPLLKTVEQMSKISGLGESKLRELMEKRELEYVENGNRRLLTEQAIRDWYERNKVTPRLTIKKKRRFVSNVSQFPSSEEQAQS